MKTTINTSEPRNGVIQVTVSGDGRNLARFYVKEGEGGEASKQAFEQYQLADEFMAEDESAEDSPPAE